MSDYITGELVRVGAFSEAEQPFGETMLACAVVVMDREQLKAVRALPMYDRVAIIRTEELEQLERDHADLEAHADRVNDANDRLLVENAALKIERNRYKVALEDIALANDQWPGYKAREVLEKEAQP